MNLTMLRRVTVAGLVLVLCGGYVAAQDPDPLIATWVLNVRKSNFSPGPGPQAETCTYTLETQQTKVTSRTSEPRTYLSVGQEIRATSITVDGDGTLTTAEWTIVYDGRDRPIAGDVDADMLSVRRVDRYLKEFTKKRAGRTVITGTYAISTDGTVMTVTSTGRNARGQAIKDVAVFDKQQTLRSDPKLTPVR
jgi:hypothetical protein